MSALHLSLPGMLGWDGDRGLVTITYQVYARYGGRLLEMKYISIQAALGQGRYTIAALNYECNAFYRPRRGRRSRQPRPLLLTFTLINLD